MTNATKTTKKIMEIIKTIKDNKSREDLISQWIDLLVVETKIENMERINK